MTCGQVGKEQGWRYASMAGERLIELEGSEKR